METNFLYYLVFAGIIQGFFLSLFILGSKKNGSKASTYLGLLILSITLSNLQYTLDELGLISWDNFNLIYLPYVFLLPPLIYFFVISYLYPIKKTKKIELLLYVPFLFYLSISLLYKIIALSTRKTSLNNDFQEELADLIDVYGDFVNIPVILIAIIFSFISIKNYSKIDTKAKVTIHRLLWIKVFLVFILLTLPPWLYYTYKYWQDENNNYLPMFLIASFTIYVFGYIGIHKINILNQRHKIRSFIKESTNNSTIEKSKSTHISKIEDIIVHDKRYLDPNISLDTLSEELQLSKSHLSRIINTELNTSFSDYVNSLRISEAKKLLLNPEFSNYTLVAIGLESGFNSKTTFNTTFKKLTSQTPSGYRKNKAN